MKAENKGWIIGTVIGALVMAVVWGVAQEWALLPDLSRAVKMLISFPIVGFGVLAGGEIGRWIATRRAGSDTPDP